MVIDSYNDFETAVWFVTNPEGVRQDRTVSNDAQFTTGMPMNGDWNAHWDVVTSKDGRGWFAEFRIPFSTLGFQVVGGEVTMGLIAYRMIPRKNERQTYPAMDPSSGRLGFARPSRAQRVVLRDVRQATPLYMTPLRPGRSPADPGFRALGGRGGGMERRIRPDHRGRARRQVLADLQPRARPDRQTPTSRRSRRTSSRST